MGIGVSIFLLALGAILAFAVNESSLGPLELSTVGVILMICGLIGLALALYAMSSARRSTVVRDETYLRDRPRDPGVY